MFRPPLRGRDALESTFLVGSEIRPRRWHFGARCPSADARDPGPRRRPASRMGRTPHEVTRRACVVAGPGARSGRLTPPPPAPAASACRPAPGSASAEACPEVPPMIELAELRTAPSIPVADELDRFEDGVRRYLAGELDDDAFRVFRLNQGIYGQRQGGTQPDGAREGPARPRRARAARDARPRRRRVLARLGPPHHPPERAVPLRAARADARRCCACSRPVGLTSREACGDTVRNVAGCHLAGACPYEVLDISPWAEATTDSSCATRSPSACRASSRSTSPAAPPTAARRCSTTSA